MNEMSTSTVAPFSVAPKPIQYSYFCRFDEPVSILVCPKKEMMKWSDLEEDTDGEKSFQNWIQEKRSANGK